MPFKGPGCYEIVPYQVPTLNLNSAGGNTSPGEKIITYDRGDYPSSNALWTMALVGGSEDDAEYVILNNRSGYYLTATEDEKVTSCQNISPADPKARWRLVFTPSNGYDVWTINSVHFPSQLNVEFASLKPEAQILCFPIENKDNSKFYFDPR